jgi:outer membrane protein OmpA-like peptidoglycan-associated protein
MFIGTVNAQDANNPWAIDVGANAIDFYPTGNENSIIGVGGESDELFDEFFNVTDHWNIIPSVSYLGVSRYIGDGFIVGVEGSLNRIDQIGDRSPNQDLQFYSVGGDVSYSLKQAIKSKWIDPFVSAGAGYTWLESEATGGIPGFGTANGGLGIRFWFNENFNIRLESGYRHAFEEESNRHFQHIAALGIAFGGKDTDGDGIYDRDDACPEVPGLEEFNGCPDTDGDGIVDSKDACPNVPGVAEFDGCADSDGDGIPDPKDACPTVAGTAALGGCPDADGDGIKDSDDNCPNEAGPRANNGCPYLDRDGDGVLDKDDNCPDEVGTVANDGCPEVVVPQISVEVINDLNLQFKNVLFDYNKASIRTESYPTLDNVANIMKEYTNTIFLIEGHTDDRGRDAYNLNLSDQRAASVRNYLTQRGISSSRLQSKGFGESRPVASNKTAAGRQQNRRVELSIISQ